MQTDYKIGDLQNISTRVNKLKKEGKKVGFVEGIFDVMHFGHVELTEFAKRHCDALVVGIASDEYARSSKGPWRPIFKQDLRSRMMAALEYVDLVLKEENPPALLEDKRAEEYLHKVTKTLKPDVIVASGTTDRNPDAKKSRADEIGAKFIVQKDPRPDKNSSTTQILSLLGRKK